MPTLYVTRELSEVVRERKERIERKLGVDYITEKEALRTLLNEDALKQLEQKGVDPDIPHFLEDDE